MASYLIGAVYALMSAFVGMMLPMVSAIGPLQRPTNLLFGFVYGFGWFVAGFVRDVRSQYVESLGSWVWPLAVMLMTAYFLGRQLQVHPERSRVIALCSILVLFLIVPGNLVATTPLKYIPTYSAILLSVY